MLFIVEEMQNYTHAWPFLEPVNMEEVADYYDVIKDPMGKIYDNCLKMLIILFRFGYVRRKCKGGCIPNNGRFHQGHTKDL
jgi:hypothetical protein